jgi:capsular polysaccharide transport system permease protein
MLAADPQVSQAFSEALLTYAEERVDQMSQRLREDQMAGARDSFEDAETRVVEAQQRVLALQERRGVLSAEAEVSAVFGRSTPSSWNCRMNGCALMNFCRSRAQ